MNMDNTANTVRVYILGAGCSARYGYPISTNFGSELEAYGQTLDDKAKCLKRCVDETASLMRQGNVQSIDDLVLRISDSVFDDSNLGTQENYLLRQQRIQNAKIVTAALFLSKEVAAKKSDLGSYHNFILKLFPGGNPWQHRLRNANCRVLTFNYDRLFEMAFLGRVAIDTGQFPLYSEHVLNSGFNDILGRRVEFGTGGFRFLKLHGSVGIRGRYEDIGFRYYPYYDGRVPGQKEEIDDQLFFANADKPSPSERDAEPLIVFPHEKHYVQSGTDANLPYREYILNIWRQAEIVIGEASEIWVVGYSFAALDRKPILDLLAKATRCKKFVIQNRPGEAEGICRRLSVEHSELGISWQPYPEEF